MDRLEDSIRQLRRFPRSGKAGRVAGTRELVLAELPYVVVYEVRGKTVNLARILHAAQRWPPNKSS